MSDLIDREQAKDAIDKYLVGRDLVTDGTFMARLINEIVIDRLPSAEPEIIYCGDCKYKDDGIDEDGIPFLKCLHGRSYGGTRINDFCSWAEKREENNESN